MFVPEFKWTELENWLRIEFAGLIRKAGGEPMAEHSIRIGRKLRDHGHDDVTVFGGYTHDLFEDVSRWRVLAMTARQHLLFPIALSTLGDVELAHQAVILTAAACYTDDEYLLSKAERKEAACARWLATPDRRLWEVKIHDVDDNDASCEAVSTEFARSYRAWAKPFRERLMAKCQAEG